MHCDNTARFCTYSWRRFCPKGFAFRALECFRQGRCREDQHRPTFMPRTIGALHDAARAYTNLLSGRTEMRIGAIAQRNHLRVDSLNSQPLSQTLEAQYSQRVRCSLRMRQPANTRFKTDFCSVWLHWLVALRHSHLAAEASVRTAR